ncbi:baseplate assembly protein [Mannheimia granulomatis]|uniref:Baseplate assembly protein n=1 Tax=Mannheimia granulomatis TaxID=85402 RepID=A0A011MGN7_9PAST|nr:phage baseplate assembly protein V [Mannheimia granulomatis]EXI61671.1 baseplate assembly protein [Mannheimia granulomatis]RGE48270.1 baseplate assembly protein [Mannheimia granulomatis]
MSEPNQTDLLRRLDNLIRLGTIAEVDLATATARVNSGGITTDFLPWIILRAGTSQTWSAPTVGEQCVVLSVSGEFTTGVILPAIYTQNAPSQSEDDHIFHFSDGAEICYNTASSQLTVKNCKLVIVQATESITLDTPTVKATKNVVIGGNLSVKGTTSSQGAISTQGAVTAKGDVSGAGISLGSHHHIEQGDGRATSGAKP